MEPIKSTPFVTSVSECFQDTVSSIAYLARKIAEAVKACFLALLDVPKKIHEFFNSFHHSSAPISKNQPIAPIASRRNEWSKLHQASLQHKNKELESLLTLYPVNEKDKHDGTTPLHAAILKDNLEGVKLLLASGAELEARDVRGQTPMHWAARKGNVAILNLLFIFGGDINVRDLQGKTPLRMAAKYGHLDAVSMLVALGADMEICDIKKQTPYFVARLHGHLNIAQFLADVGANTDIVNIDGRTAAEVSGRACLSAYIRQLRPFGKHELNEQSRRNLLDKVVMIA